MSVTNFERLQTDVVAKLLSEPLLADVNVKSLRKMQITSELDATLIWTTARPGGAKTGAGILVGMPTFNYPVPNVAGPERELLLPVSTFENPVQNISNTGTNLMAEQIVDIVDAILARFQIESLGAAIYTKRSTPNTDTPGVVRYDTMLNCTVPRSMLTQVLPPNVHLNSIPAAVTITNNEPGSTIYYTIDGSFPGPGNVDADGNILALVYAAPFAVPVDTLVRCAAYLAGKIGSDETYGIIRA